MKRRLFTFALAALTIGLLGSCSKINERIDDLDKRVYDLANNKIASIDQQITAINTSINDLKAADVTINGKIDELKATAQAQQTLIDALKEADKALGQKDTELEAGIATLEGQVATINGQIATLEDADKAINLRIDTLQSYVDTEIGETKDWAEETFATLEQYQQTADDLATLSVTVTGISTTLTGVQTSITGLDTKINGIDADLQDKIASAKTELEGKITSLKTELEDKIASAITESEKSIKSWINELLEGYYKAAVVDEKINALNTAIEASKSTAKTRIDSLATELTKTKAAVDTVKANIRTEYKNAIDVAINKLDGEIRGALLDSIAAVNARIEALDTRVKTLEGKVLALEGKVDKLLAMIQSVSITPAYSDGSVEAVDSILTLKCIVSPAEALIGMESLKDSLLIYADSVKVKTKATTPAYMTIKVSEASVLDAAQGAITLTADISEYLPKGEGKALTVAVNIKNGISDFTTKFVPVYVATKTFKAVYDTNGGANTLTFYYDAVDHSGEGIVYEGTGLFNTEGTTAQKKWGYNDKRGEIKSVVIDASVAGYKGLTSTAYMFQSMTTATNISGAEYLNVSNVTDMSFMFNNFGGGTSGSPTTINVVPDVSKWNTDNVTNMAGMFAYYGNNSELDKVPDVSGWNTGKVTDMSWMFQKYGHESQNFNAVPDVSNWDTGNVTNMENIFYEYGHKSTVLNTVPDVSNWNTGKVENMQQMFYEYGKKSQNINCVLDLSGWDLSKITERNGEKVFNFDPSTFNVTIPAKTGAKSNEGGKWYYGDGTNSITPPTGKTFTPAAPTISTIADVLATAGDNAPSAANHWNDTKGNYIYTNGGQLLVYVSLAGGTLNVALDNTVTPNGDNYLYSAGVLSFTFNMTEGVLTSIYVNASVYGVNDTFSPAGTLEYVEIGGVKWAMKNLGAEKVTDSGDYFAWGETAPYYTTTGGWPSTPTWKSEKESGYAWQSYCGSSSFSEWSTPPYDATTKILKPEFDAAAQILGNGWRMPTSAEFQALYDACGGTKTPKTGGSTSTTEKGVYWCDNYDGVKGLLFCDGTNKLFFPAAGYGSETSLKSEGSQCRYWSSSLFNTGGRSAYYLSFIIDSVSTQASFTRYYGFSVRPVKAAAAGDSGNGTEQYNNNSNPNWF